MNLKENFEYWKISLDNLESVGDEYYFSDEIVIDNEDLLQKVERLRELIITYCVLKGKEESSSNGEYNAVDDVFQEIYDIILNINNIQYNEFVAFWKVLDISFSVFSRKVREKKEVLKDILSNYCERRREYYDQLGYSHTTIQAMYDNAASRRKGGTANTKLIDLINEYLHNPVYVKSLSDFEKEDVAYCLPDSGDASIFYHFKKKYNINYIYGKKNQGKMFDMFLKVKEHFFFIEAKHMKEGGGAQNKQVAEIINFIRYSEDNPKFHYVTFMDGIYFNRYSRDDIRSGTKTDKQKSDIERFLRENKSNLFINTAGLRSLLLDLR